MNLMPQHKIESKTSEQIKELQRLYLEFLNSLNYEGSYLFQLKSHVEEMKFVFLTEEGIINPHSFLTQLEFKKFRFLIDILSASSAVFEWDDAELTCVFDTKEYFISKSRKNILIIPYEEPNLSSKKYGLLGNADTLQLTQRILEGFFDYLLCVDKISRLNENS